MAPVERRVRASTLSRYSGNYKLPARIGDDLESRLLARKNAAKAMRLAVFIARYHTGPRSNRASFVLVREKLMLNEDLCLTENQIRGAIKTLIEVGFLEKLGNPGYERCTRTRSGVKRRCANYRLGADFQSRFSFLRKPSKVAPAENYQSPKCRRNTFLGESPRLFPRKARATIAVHSGDFGKRGSCVSQRETADAGLASALLRFEALFQARRSGASSPADQIFERRGFLEKPIFAEAGNHVCHA